MNTELLFSIQLPWQQTTYENLKKLAVHYKWEGGSGHWIFKIKDVKQVELIIGKPVLIPEYRDQFNKERVEIEGFKGHDKLEVREFPKIYQVIDHRKIETEEGYEIQETTKEVPRALVDTIYKGVIAHLPLNKPIKTSTIAEKICLLLRLERFYRDSGNFDFAKFFGERRDYSTYFYYPVKVLVHLGKIRHHKIGMIERLV